jgi:3-oxoacyl-[acyl-carrier protein] reductase
MDLMLKGKKCLIMSSSKGIGKGIALALAQEGVEIILTSSNKENLEKAAFDIESKSGIRPKYFQADSYNIPDYLQKTEEFLKSVRGVDILITNSPGPKPILCSEINEANLQQAIDANLKSHILTSQLALPYMVNQNWGRLIHLTSTTGKEPEEGMILSNFTRSAVGSYSKTVAIEYGKNSITSNTILTGGVLTDRAYQIANKEAISKNVSVDEIIKKSMGLFPTGYFPEPLEFGKIIAFLCSPLASFINGVSLPLDGGITKSL